MGLKVLFVASEVSPFAKSGGLGDVAGSLPTNISKLGVDIRVVFPKYKIINEKFLSKCEYLSSFDVTLDWRKQKADIYTINAEVPTYMIGNDYYFGRAGYYGYGDDNERFGFFAKAAIEFLDHIDFVPDVIHCNDWQTGPICLYIKDRYSKLRCFANVKTLFTIHNLQYQGLFSRDTLPMLELDANYYFTGDKLEFHNAMSFMKAGLVYSDAISTVSKTYADEIQTYQYGYGLDGMLRSRAAELYGIVNGIDYDKNNPATSDKIFDNYTLDNLEGKKANKRKLQELLNLPQRDDVPVFSMITRLVDQKGVNVVLQAANELLSKDVQLVILGTGDYYYENMFRDLAYRYPDKVSTNILFDDTLAQRIYAGSDFFLMPSFFEPCGLGQLFSMSYGTIPIVRQTGGLNDTVVHFNAEVGGGNGFLFKDYDVNGIMWAINEGINVYYNKVAWAKLVQNAMNTNFSWDESAKKYLEIYNNLVK